MLIRPATLADAPGLARVHVDSWRAAYQGIMPDSVLDGLDVGAFEAHWKRTIEQGTRSTLIGEVEDQLVGFASLGPSRDADAVPLQTGELYALYLHPHVWGRGVGYALWSAALQRLDRFSEVTLWVLETNARARAFYERVGFRLEPNAVRSLEREGAVLPEVRYRKRISA